MSGTRNTRVAKAVATPILTAIEVDALGYLWVREYNPPGDEDRALWTVLDSRGFVQGFVETPSRLVVHQIGEDFILGKALDELGVEYVQLWGLDRREARTGRSTLIESHEMIRTATCRALVACLLSTPLLTAQEVIILPGEDRGLEPRFEELYRVGSPSGEDWEQFGSIRRVAFDEAGQLYVFDMQARYIFVVARAASSAAHSAGPARARGSFATRTGSR